MGRPRKTPDERAKPREICATVSRWTATKSAEGAAGLCVSRCLLAPSHRAAVSMADDWAGIMMSLSAIHGELVIIAEDLDKRGMSTIMILGRLAALEDVLRGLSAGRSS